MKSYTVPQSVFTRTKEGIRKKKEGNTRKIGGREDERKREREGEARDN